ncbi:glycosyltransferase [Synechococcus sp. CCY 9618]|uniref:glycosyltransferase n=1 Tax=Synechococcus sp. CCY 9618 TaxID=2815602 RepID=UPI001C248E7F|nr:cellulose synthase catalytic subunit [Synechococcus sp. CCY 9618]
MLCPTPTAVPAPARRGRRSGPRGVAAIGLPAVWALVPLLALAAEFWPGTDGGIRLALPAASVLLWGIVLTRRPEQSLPVAARRSAIAVTLVLALRYLLWRAGSTLNLDTPVAAALSLTMLAAELMLLGIGLLQLVLALFAQPPVETESEQAARALQSTIARDPRRLPAVDALVPCCGEPVELIERSLRGVLAIDYPRLTAWLLDDGDRPELAALCQRLGCRYLSRPVHRHAKAGNLNAALPQLEGDLLAVFDADVVPLRSFLQRTVGLFDDPRVGLVQTPQTYMTADPVIRNLRLERWLMPDEEYFYRWIEPTRQAVGAVVCAGTSFLMRRSALERVGGFEIGTPSEDLATGIRLAAAGYRNVYVNEKLSAGLTPLTLAAMATQRCRWASGTLQTLRTGASPLTIPGLSPLQRLAYMEGILHWLNVIPQLVLLLMPLSLGVFGVAPIVIAGSGWLSAALPFVLAQLLLVGWLSRGARSALMPELYRWVFLVPLCRAVLATAVGRPRSFQVTAKSVQGLAAGPSAALVAPLVLLLALQLLNLALLVGGVPLRPGALAPLSISTLAAGLAASGFSALALVAALRCCWERLPDDAHPWFRPEPAPTALSAPGGPWLATAAGPLPVRIRAISERGLELQLSPAAAGYGLVPEGGSCELIWPGAGSSQPWRLAVRCVHRKVSGWRLGADWAAQTGAQRRRLQALLYGSPGLWPTRQAPFEPLALLVVLGRLLSVVPAQGWFRRSTLPIRLPVG